MLRAQSLLWCAVALFATEGRAAARVALHPSEVVDATPKDAARVHALIERELIRAGAALVPSTDVKRFLAKRADRSCAALGDAERTRCLGELARSAQVDRAVLITVAP